MHKYARTARIVFMIMAGTLAMTPQLRSIDQDLDGLDDSIENVLALRFAPVLYLHTKEAFYPATPVWFMDRTHMRYNHNNCSDDQILNLGQVNNTTIGQQAHQDKNILCSHSGSNNLSSGGTTTSKFFLQIPNDDNEETTRLGIRNVADWVCYVNVRRSRAFFEHFDVQYWFFYARNGNLGGVGGEHEGDWERITVRVYPDQTTIQAIYYAAHGDEGMWYFPGEYALESGRPVVYAARDSHASYPTIGQHVRNNLPDDFTNAGLRHDFLGATSRLGTPSVPANGHLWLNYNGFWGERGSIFSGPSGPGFKGSYILEDVGNNPPPEDHHFAEKDGNGCTIGLLVFSDGLGQVDCPWATLAIGLAETPDGHMLRLLQGSYPTGQLTINQSITITSYGGRMVTLR